MKNMIEALNWRYATKQYDVSKKLSDSQIDDLLEAIRLAPSSFGLQPFRVFVIKNSDMRAKLRVAGYDQSPITDASHFLVFAVIANLSEVDIDKFINLIVRTRNDTPESLAGYRDMIKSSIDSKTVEGRVEWASKQAYLALGVLLTCAAIAGIDATPMEGFDPAKFDTILGLNKLGYHAVVLAALGYRAETDTYARLAKVRLSKSEFITNVK